MFKSLIIAFSTYSKLPMPRVEWDEKSMRYSMCFFPLVGAATGLFSLAAFYAMRSAGFGTTAVSAMLTALPVLLNGGIHMDGFLDTVDARSSYQPAEEKLKILKDPHTGAFAIIYGIVYFIFCFGLFSEISEGEIGCIAAGYVYARILSALSVVTFQKAKRDGMAAASANAADKSVKWILAAELALCCLLLIGIHPGYGTVCILAGAGTFFYYRRMAYRTFGGITGDLAGYFLQVCELFMLLFTVLAAKII